MLSFDEYNVCYKAPQTGMLDRPKDWPVSPVFSEEVYNHEEALIPGGAMIALLNTDVLTISNTALRHCERV